jgi:mannitol/fructose-specific phosphotransferase system IIA component (Ntr-type)
MERPTPQMPIGREELIILMRTAFNAASQQSQKDAENTIMNLLKQPPFLKQLVALINDPTDLPRKGNALS